jgi:hypothetical protein
MRLVALREELLRIGWKVGGAILLACLIMGYSFYDRQSREDELAKIQRETALSRNRIVKLEDENNRFIQQQLRFNRIPKRQRDVQLNDLPSRIAVLQPTLQNLKVRYRLAVLDINLTNVAPFIAAQDQKKYATQFNTITLNFGGLSDELILSFLQELFRTLPGYIRVEKMEMKRDLEITQDVLGQIQGQSIPVLVSGSIVFTWKTVRQQ